ncbi:hypothetical protein [Marinobacter shengliensis]|uniref:hypothetical protein n=1 Tax=Marinobacter shengliensis TaxID=1389223 RepID=UPI001E317B7B|nr:hypothetical protein [Marinobacter shengliensis]
MVDALTIDQFKQALPATLKKSVNPSLIAEINNKLSDPDMYETYRENLLGYAHVMKEGKFKVSNYIDAVKYVSFKLMGKTNIDAFSLTFPDKIKRWQNQGLASKDIASYVTAYNKSKLVNLIYEQTLTPFWVLNQDVYQKAINTQLELMQSANSEKVRSDAANSILTHLKPPETRKIELDIGVKEDSAINALRDATAKLAEQQMEAIRSGKQNAQEVAHSSLLIEEGEVVDE